MTVTQQKIKEMLDYDKNTGDFKWKTGNWKGKETAGTFDKRSGYNRIGIRGKSFRADRIALLWVYGFYPEYDVIHLNKKNDDDRIDNLMEALC